ncbi:NUDIX hydrolase [Pseudoruegeria sp. SK021]|uniref:NUDIX hydrolase n=1 Tax=Pseudoruegeria sp. SK021 TaxID=1933035 RepID=UPI000A22AAD1|nr:NUDIX hydrolase [Pseudoruegeria sp. SK021]OSP54624.1 NUDIX hydrolase [Pseudoruegeria sp. SK021]
MRRFGDPAVTGTVYTRRPGAYAVLLRGGDVLLTHQMSPVPEFQLPGGGIDPGEHPVHALHREVFEETGWRMAAARRIGSYRRFTFMPEYDLWAEKVCTIYLARPVRRLGPPSEPGHTAVWMPIETAATKVASPGDRAALRRVLSGVV